MAKSNREIKIKRSPDFEKSYPKFLKNNSPIKDRLESIIDRKTKIPPEKLPNGWRDHSLDRELKGFWECHLSGDILLLYTLKNDILHLVEVCDHDDLYKVKKKLKKYLHCAANQNIRMFAKAA